RDSHPARASAAKRVDLLGVIHKWLLVDSGFWIGLLDPSDPCRPHAQRLRPVVERCHVLLPWPCMYEFLRSRLAKRADTLVMLREILSSPALERVDDAPYRDIAVERCLSAGAHERGLSLADHVLRGIASNENVKVHGIVTFNAK